MEALMKSISLLSLVLFMFLGTLAHAEPEISVEPGPVRKVNAEGLEAMLVLAHLTDQKEKNAVDFLKSGDLMTGASVRGLKPSLIEFNFAITHLHIKQGGAPQHLGGSTLRVLRSGRFPKDYKYDTTLSYIKG